MPECCQDFELPPLPYTYDALEPYIDTETVKIHHDRHFKGYVYILNAALNSYPQYFCYTLEKLLICCRSLPFEIQQAVRDNGGGVYNHTLYFAGMGNCKLSAPFGRLGNRIQECFGSFASFREKFTDAALNQFGSGYAWLVSDNNQNLKIVTTPNQNTPLAYHCHPILTIDVWEHAYYLKYQNKRKDYIEAWFHLVNWEYAERRYEDLCC